jgi:DNA repair photolyase
MATTKSTRTRLPVTLTPEEADLVARAAGGARLAPSTWARAELVKAAERSAPVVTARAERLAKDIEAGIPGGREHAATVSKHRRGWARGR